MFGEYLLAIDNGTQSVRALIFDLRGTLIAKSRVPIKPYFSAAPGLAKDSIAAVALTTQRSTVINVDAGGRPLRPAIVWLDQRRTEGLKPVGGVGGVAFRGVGPT